MSKLYAAAQIDFIVDLPTIDPAVVSESSSSSSTTIAFGSCHKNKYANPQIWESIRNENPVAFLWTGDSIYPPIRNVASLPYLQEEYEQMKSNRSIGYTQLLDDRNNNNNNSSIPIFGTWDDHDYGGNDRGNDMTQRMERARLFYQFINQTVPRDVSVLSNNNNNNVHETPPLPTTEREGIYYSVEFRHQPMNRKERPPTVRVIFLDTRFHRTAHCIPSLAGHFPLGAGIACLSRWFAAGLLQQYCLQQQHPPHATILGATQWEWLRQQIHSVSPPPDVLVVVSSIQVYTTNPAMEGWGHFPLELRRLSELLLYASRQSVVTVLSGDVHHGEILNPFAAHQEHSIHKNIGNNANSKTTTSTATSIQEPHFLEVTSSGLTHDCSKHIYGHVCVPLLRTFHRHRYQSISNYYIGKNYGTISIDWTNQNVSINVHDAMTGTIQLSTGSRSFVTNSIVDDTNVDTELLLNSIIPCMDNHLVPYINIFGKTFLILLLITVSRYVYWTRQRQRNIAETYKEKKL